jgi:hypothetical protein
MNPFAEAYLDEVMDWNANGIGEPAAKEVAFDVLSALAACHGAGVAHCNVRPEVGARYSFQSAPALSRKALVVARPEHCADGVQSSRGQVGSPFPCLPRWFQTHHAV